MTDFDPTDPWGQKSPWDVAQPDTNPTAPEAPVTNQPVATPENVTLSFKGGAGYDASLLVVRAGSLAELDQMLDQEAAHLKSVMEKAARVQAYSTSLNSATKTSAATAAPATQPSFNPASGQVQYSQPAQAPQAPFGGGAPGDSCVHGRTPRSGTNQKGPWSALFCNERDKNAQCKPLWKQKDGSYA